jgi:hypothetical protein
MGWPQGGDYSSEFESRYKIKWRLNFYFFASFEKELRNKLTLKATAHQTEENILLKSLKYFDLNNSGKIDRTNFLKAVEKIGITISNQKVNIYNFLKKKIVIP